MQERHKTARPSLFLNCVCMFPPDVEEGWRGAVKLGWKVFREAMHLIVAKDERSSFQTNPPVS